MGSYTRSSIPSSTHQPCFGGNGTQVTWFPSRKDAGTWLRESTRSIYIHITSYYVYMSLYVHIYVYMYRCQHVQGVCSICVFYMIHVYYIFFGPHTFPFIGTGICGFSLLRLMLKALPCFFRWEVSNSGV